MRWCGISGDAMTPVSAGESASHNPNFPIRLGATQNWAKKKGMTPEFPKDPLEIIWLVNTARLWVTLVYLDAHFDFHRSLYQACLVCICPKLVYCGAFYALTNRLHCFAVLDVLNMMHPCFAGDRLAPPVCSGDWQYGEQWWTSFFERFFL